MPRGRKRIDKWPGVYEIVNEANQKCYVGSTTHHWWNRVSNHFCLLNRGKHNSKIMQADFTANPDAFKTRFVCPAKDFVEGKQIEDRLIQEYRSKGLSYNGNDAVPKEEKIYLSTSLTKDQWNKLHKIALEQKVRPAVILRELILKWMDTVD